MKITIVKVSNTFGIWETNGKDLVTFFRAFGTLKKARIYCKKVGMDIVEERV